MTERETEEQTVDRAPLVEPGDHSPPGDHLPPGDHSPPGDPAPAGGRPPAAGRAPSPRLLDRAPSERYVQAAERPAEQDPGRRGSPLHALWGGIAAGATGVVIFVLAAGGLSFDWGLVVVAVYIGWSVAEGVTIGGGAAVDKSTRRNITVVLAVAALTVAEAGTWAWARGQGGNLSFLEHLWATYGLLVPVQYVAALVAAAWSAR